jgi:uncharacterized membrane protein
MYLAGLIGLFLPVSRPIFLQTTSFNLWVSVVLLLLFHQNWSKTTSIVFTLIFVLGYFVEVLGVKTGIIFGEYYYGNTLGLKIFNVPVAIGANWLVLSYLFSYLSEKYFNKFIRKTFFRVLFSSISMVMLDFLIEPIAIKFDFWHWQANSIPLQNYFAWFICSFCFIYVVSTFIKPIKNNLAFLLLLLQVLFFLFHNLLSFALE